MTVASTQNRSAFRLDGSSTQFDFLFPYQKPVDVWAILRSPAGVETQLAYLSDFSLASTGTGGRLTLVNPRANGWTLTILRAPLPLQETDLINNDTYSEETLESALDYQAMVSQRAFDLLARALVLPDSDTPGSGAYNAGANRIANLADGTAATDATTLAQVQALVLAGGGGGGGTVGWPTTPVPQPILNQIFADPALNALFAPINTNIGSLYASTSALISDVSSINTSIGNIQLTAADMQAQIDLLTTIGGDVSGIVTLITTETNQRIAGDAASAAVLAKIGAADGDNVSFLLNLSTVKVSPTETLSVRLSSTLARLNSADAAVNTEQTARIAAGVVTAQTISKIGALSGDGLAFIFDLNTAKVTPTETLAQRLNSIAAGINGANAAIASETSVRAAADTSIASQITTMQSSVSGFSVAIQANATAINGVYASYGVKIDNNGRVSGFGLLSQANNGAIVSTFNFNSDAFNIWNGAANVAPFSVSGGIVYMQNVKVTSLEALSADLGNITAGNITLGANSKILFDNGSFIWAQGLGFGTSNQFLEWYGPRPTGGNLALCSEATGISYKKTNGQDKHGGTLGVNIIKIAYASTDVSGSAIVLTGDFATPGGTKNITVAYDYLRTFRCNASTGGISGGPSSVTISIEKSTDSGVSWTVITSFVAPETQRAVAVDGDPGIQDRVTLRAAGNLQTTDSAAATSTLSYRARITARTLSTMTGTSPTGITETQNLSLVSIENV